MVMLSMGNTCIWAPVFISRAGCLRPFPAPAGQAAEGKVESRKAARGMPRSGRQ